MIQSIYLLKKMVEIDKWDGLLLAFDDFYPKSGVGSAAEPTPATIWVFNVNEQKL